VLAAYPEGHQGKPLRRVPPAGAQLQRYWAEEYASEVWRQMFPWDGTQIGAFRLQLFTAPGTRPVGVATQYFPGEGGPLGTAS